MPKAAPTNPPHHMHIPAVLYERLEARAEQIRRETGKHISWQQIAREAIESKVK